MTFRTSFFALTEMGNRFQAMAYVDENPAKFKMGV